MKLQRDQVVAATLVGTVVVVLGFASGLGRVPVAQGGSTQTPNATKPTQQEAHHPQANPVPHPVGHNNPVQVAHPPLPHVPAPTHPHQTVPPRTTPPTKPPSTAPTTPPNEPCDPDVVKALLKQLGVLVDELPVVSELIDGSAPIDELSKLDLSPLLGLLGAAPKPPADLPAELPGGCKLLVDEKSGKVTGLLDTP
ncbi:hypothetical protein FXN61_01365 [Lentzea sp. PSKA42]|uniref:Secreted protein n=1 Tax=Lentzea indica TaxID=2604800 RepID=A0ABX1F9N8_9PSEU|nr:hypothetical protein [Lentzea indica]NKE55542.1 hypothetical protein [Lentzea indica]